MTPHNDVVRYRDVLAVREFRGLLLSDGLSGIGDQIARIAVALLVLERSGSAFAASATYACSYITWLLGGPLLSALSDRYPRRRLMVVTDLLRMALVAALALDLPLWGVFALLGLAGLLAPPADAARSGLLADVLDGERYVVANALSNAVNQAAQVLGFVLGGGLVALVGVKVALLVDAGTFAASAGLLLVLVHEHVVLRLPDAARLGLVQDMTAGARLLLRTPRLRMLLSWGLLSATSVISAEGLAVAIAQERGGGPLAAGLLTAAVPAGFLLGSWWLLRRPTERRESLFPVLVTTSCLPLLLTPLVPSLGALTLLWVVSGFGNALQLVANAAFVQAVPPHLRGRAFGVAVTLLMATQGAVLLTAGALAEVTGPRLPVAVAALLALVAVPFLRVRASVPATVRRTVAR